MLAFHMGPCRVQVNFSFFALIAFCCIFTGAEGGLACFMAVFIHEAAHLIVMGALKAWPGKVVLSALGCRMELPGNAALTDRQNMLISLAGPGANWLSAALAAALAPCGSAFFGASFALAFAHSMPIEPLDAGLAIRYLLSSVYGADKGEYVSRMISTIFLVPLAALGFLVLFRSRYNYSLLALSVYLILYLALKWDLSAP